MSDETKAKTNVIISIAYQGGRSLSDLGKNYSRSSSADRRIASFCVSSDIDLLLNSSMNSHLQSFSGVRCLDFIFFVKHHVGVKTLKECFLNSSAVVYAV